VTANTVDKEGDRVVIEYGENKATQVMCNYFSIGSFLGLTKSYILCLICCTLLWSVAVYCVVAFTEW